MKFFLLSFVDRLQKDNYDTTVSTALNRDRFIRFADALKSARANHVINDYSVIDEQPTSKSSAPAKVER